MFYDGSLTGPQFLAALCCRLGVIPRHLDILPVVCGCGVTVTTPEKYFGHIFLCDKLSRITHTYRHNLVRDSIAMVARSFGITVSKEPTCYVYPDAKRRPDLLFHTLPTPIAIDVTIVSPEEGPGDAAKSAEERKVKTHQTHVEKLQHRFLPFALESFGLIGHKAYLLIDSLSRSLPSYSCHLFKKMMLQAVASAAARGRADTMYSAKHLRVMGFL